MTRKDIVNLPDPVLRQRARRVGYIDQEIKQLAQDMIEATLDWEDHRPNEAAVALAANQVGAPYRLIIIRNDTSDKADKTFQILVNPKVTKLEGTPELGPEGCLSIPDIYGQVARYPKIKVSAQTLEGQPVRFTAQGFAARIIQHEIDHTHGQLFIDHVKDNRFFRLGAKGKMVPLKDHEIRTDRFLRHRTDQSR